MKSLKCKSNITYEDCLTVGKLYDVSIEDNGMKHLVDDDGEELQTMLDLFYM